MTTCSKHVAVLSPENMWWRVISTLNSLQFIDPLRFIVADEAES
jgi:hypothetical protein